MLKQPLKGSAPSKISLTCWRATLSIEKISESLNIPPSDVVTKFRDGRVTSWFAEIWGERLFSYKKHLNSNHPGSDGSIELGHIGPFNISVRSLTNAGIKFQKSKDIGSKRRASQHDLYNAISDVERVVIVDIRNFPDILFMPLDSKWLLRHAHNGTLTPSGLSAAKLYQLIHAEFAVNEQSFDLSLALKQQPPADVPSYTQAQLPISNAH
jgi:hypothetical protein